jgi:hypothetical protein
VCNDERRALGLQTSKGKARTTKITRHWGRMLLVVVTELLSPMTQAEAVTIIAHVNLQSRLSLTLREHSGSREEGCCSFSLLIS